MSIAASKCGRRAAFTLLEIMLAVAILAMMSLAIYRFVQANIAAIGMSSEAMAIDAQYNGLRELLTAQLQNLPSGSGALTGDALKLNDRSRDEMRWIAGPGPGLLTRYAAGDYAVTLRLQPPKDKGDQLDLGVVRKPRTEDPLVDEHDNWTPLLRNVQSLQIKYFDHRLNVWLDKWTDTVTLPRLVRITIGRSDSAVPWEAIIPLGRTPW
jgi:prepilin-type N-terminal cleavage/methylation domain-containing protein